MTFEARFERFDVNHTTGRWLVFSGDQMLLRETETGWCIPGAEVLDIGIVVEGVHVLGDMHAERCLTASMHSLSDLPEGWILKPVRETYGKLDLEWIWVAFRALHVTAWQRKTRFCGVCGSALIPSETERAMVCPSCGNIIYPRISPAVIVSILKGDQILLAHSVRFPTGLYSNVAGFVEAGETLEDCVRREVMEEVGLELGEIRYFGSQPWPFPDSLMVGFIAQYKSGEIKVDQEEIADAQWFTKDTMPVQPGPLSIAKRMIDGYLQGKYDTYF